MLGAETTSDPQHRCCKSAVRQYAKDQQQISKLVLAADDPLIHLGDFVWVGIQHLDNFVFPKPAHHFHLDLK